MLFDITRPDGENTARNLITQHPEVAERLQAKLEAWAGELVPPGLSADASGFSRHHEEMFAEHDLIAKTALPAKAGKKAAPAGGIGGWACRNGALALKDGALTVTPDPNLAKNARPFLTHSALDVAGPVTITLRVRAKQAGASTFSWRTNVEKEFTTGNSVSFTWPTSTEWQDVRAELPVKGRLVHLRITPAKESAGLEIDSIALEGGSGDPLKFPFDSEQ